MSKKSKKDVFVQFQLLCLEMEHIYSTKEQAYDAACNRWGGDPPFETWGAFRCAQGRYASDAGYYVMVARIEGIEATICKPFVLMAAAEAYARSLVTAISFPITADIYWSLSGRIDSSMRIVHTLKLNQK